MLDTYEDITLKDYILGVRKVINPANIRFASRIANNRIYMYLGSKSFVDKLTLGNTNIFIKDRLPDLSVRTLIIKTKRVILSNEFPIIPQCGIKHFQANENQNRIINLLCENWRFHRDRIHTHTQLPQTDVHSWTM